MEKAQDRSITPVRRYAANILYEVTEKGAFANLALDKALRHSPLSMADKSMVTEMVNGTVRMLKHLDWVLNLFLKSNIENTNPWLKVVLRLSAYQILFMDRVPSYAVVDEAVKLVKKRTGVALSRVTNGVLRSLIRHKEQINFPSRETDFKAFLSVYYSHPEWVVDLFVNKLGGKNTQHLLEYNNQAPKLIIRANHLKVKRDRLVELLRQEGVQCQPANNTPWGIIIEELNTSMLNLNAYKKGYFYVQNEGSMLAAAILNPQPEELVYDLCSGVGGKATHLAEYMNDQGEIRAYELYHRKVGLLEENCLRMGIKVVKTECIDVLNIPNPTRRPNRVLLDAPCSGLGVLNRRADSRWHKKPEDLVVLSSLQGNMLVKAGELVGDNGWLLYSTCTIATEENEAVIEAFLNKYPRFEMHGFADHIAFFPLDEQDRQAASRGMLTIIPGKYGTDGMFYALMRRKAI
ncbi:16S rRNA (cytosine(967)-C(5))-methyltransferase RsmB [Syntrophomonas erecta]